MAIVIKETRDADSGPQIRSLECGAIVRFESSGRIYAVYGTARCRSGVRTKLIDLERFSSRMVDGDKRVFKVYDGELSLIERED